MATRVAPSLSTTPSAIRGRGPGRRRQITRCTGLVACLLRGAVQSSMLGALGRSRQLPRPAVRPRRFADAGLVLLRSRPEDGPEIWCRCDGGPHGFLSIAAHAHADALSLEVRHDGVDIFADPGTYCYHGEPAWREWFRSTAGHNTVELDGLNQAESGGPFLWTTQVRTTTLTCDVGEQPVQTWSAEHDGYLRLKNPTTHRRSVTLDSPRRRLTIVDTFDAGQGGSSAAVLALRPRRPSRSKRSPRNAFLAGRPGHQARHAHTSRGPGVDLSSGQSRPDRRLVFAPLCRSCTRQFPDRARNCIDLNPPRHPAGVALSDHVTDLRSDRSDAAATKSRAGLRPPWWGWPAGIAYVVFSPPPLTSTTLVLLPTPALAESSSSDVDTQVRIALSNNVLDRAGQAVNPALSARSVKKKIKVSAPTNQLIQVDATSTERSTGPGALRGRRRCLRRLCHQHRKRSHCRRTGRPQCPEGQPAEPNHPAAARDYGRHEAAASSRPELARR